MSNENLLAPPSSNLPDTIPLYDAELPGNRISMQKLVEYFNRLITSITTEFDRRRLDTTPAASMLLVSPLGKVYSLTVDDTGAVKTTLEYDPTGAGT